MNNPNPVNLSHPFVGVKRLNFGGVGANWWALHGLALGPEVFTVVDPTSFSCIC